MKKWLIIGVVVLTAYSSIKGQNIPPPVDTYVQNLLQQDQMWCWAAVAQQIILWKTGNAPQQCEMVAVAKGGNPIACCSGAPCSVPGQFSDIQNLLAHYGAGYSNIAPPASPAILYNTLSQNRAIILFLNQPYQHIGHFVVLRGMYWAVNPAYGTVPMVVINDPMSVYTQPMPFANLLGLWQAAIVTN